MIELYQDGKKQDIGEVSRKVVVLALLSIFSGAIVVLSILGILCLIKY